MSIDGYLGSPTTRRLELSNDADFDRVDAVRASCDAILVSPCDPAGTRVGWSGRSRAFSSLLEAIASSVTWRISESAARFSRLRLTSTGESEKLVYCTSPRVPYARSRLGSVATVVDGGQPVEMHRLSEDLGARGVRRLMVEGGGKVHTQFLTDNLADELQLVVAPLFVGDSRAPRFVSDGRFPWNPGRRATLADVRQIGDVVLLRYALSPRFETD